MSRTVQRAAMVVVAIIVVAVGIGAWQLHGTDNSKRVGQNLPTATFGDITITVPSGWSVVQLTQQAPCPPVQDQTVVVAANGLGGDCKTGESSDSLIWLTTLSPIEIAPPTTEKVGNTTGWVHEQVGASNKRWVAALPEVKTQISFTGPIDDKTRQLVINSIHKG